MDDYLPSVKTREEHPELTDSDVWNLVGNDVPLQHLRAAEILTMMRAEGYQEHEMVENFLNLISWMEVQLYYKLK